MVGFVESGSQSPVSTNWDVWKIQPYPGASVYSGTLSGPTEMSYSMASGRNTPGFHRLRKEGKIIPSTFWEQATIVGSVSSGDYYLIWSDGFSTAHFWSTAGIASFISEWSFHMLSLMTSPKDHGLEVYEQSMVDAAAAKIYTSGWDSLTFLAELHKVVRMFRKLLKNLLRLLSDPAFRKWVLTHGVRELPNAWLEGRYGWRILMYDMIDIQKALQNVDGHRTRFKERSGYSQSHVKNYTFVDSSHGWGPTTYYLREECKVSVRGSVIADINPPEFAFNPLTTAWELIPFSFVIDWVIDIGRFLESMSFLALATDYAAAGGHKIELTREVTHATTAWTPNWVQSTSLDFRSKCVGQYVQRVPMSVSYFPTINLRLDAFKVMDLVALFLQAIRR